jgi:hypothetical protein
MQQSEAMKLIDAAIIGFQRYRSIARETAPGVSDDAMSVLEPWVFGKKCPLPAFLKLQQRGNVTAQELRNALYVITEFCPAVKITAEIELDMTFPAPFDIVTVDVTP